MLAHLMESAHAAVVSTCAQPMASASGRHGDSITSYGATRALRRMVGAHRTVHSIAQLIPQVSLTI
jgi:hypothetical protein